MRIEVRRPPVAADYQRGLESCFPGWGGRASSRWYFERPAGGPVADLLTLTQRGVARAGFALTYRRLALRDGEKVVAAIICGAWTAHEARGQGLFPRLLTAAQEVGRERGAALTLAFATGANASSRSMRRAGFAELETRYVSEPPSAVAASGTSWRPLDASTPEVEKRIESWLGASEGAVRIVYPDLAVWRAQFLERPQPAELLALSDRAWAVVQEVGDTDRVLWLSGDRSLALTTLRRRAANRGRKLFYFELEEGASEAAGDESTIQPGGMFVRSTDAGELRQALALDHEGEPAAGDLLNDSSPWYLGSWRVQGGDRM